MQNEHAAWCRVIERYLVRTVRCIGNAGVCWRGVVKEATPLSFSHIVEKQLLNWTVVRGTLYLGQSPLFAACLDPLRILDMVPPLRPLIVGIRYAAVLLCQDITKMLCGRVCVSSNVIDLSMVSAGGGVESSNAAVSHDCTSTMPIYEHCGPASSSAAAAPPAAAAERPVPRPRSTYGKYHLENLKNINAQSKSTNDDADWSLMTLFSLPSLVHKLVHWYLATAIPSTTTTVLYAWACYTKHSSP